jgi:hypothetical protein
MRRVFSGRTGGWIGVGLLSLVLAAGTARGQDSKPADGTLEGPKVKDNSMPGQKRPFGEGERRKAGERPTPMPVIAKAMDALRGEKAGENRLSEDQETRIKSVMDEFLTSTREYMQKHREEIGSLRSQLSPEDRAKVDQAFGGEGRPLRPGKGGFKGGEKKEDGGKPKGPPPKDGPMGDPMMEGPGEGKPVDAEASAKARARLSEIAAGRPKPEDAQAKAWAVLTEPQRTILDAEVKKLSEEMGKKAREGRPGGDLSDLKGKTPEEIMNDPRIPERLRERLKNMPAEQREEAIKRFLERERGGGKGGEKGGEKPAPSPSDVNVPRPPR